MRRVAGFVLTSLALGLVSSPLAVAAAASVHAQFDLALLQGSPFPSNRFTVADSTQNTGLRVKLPKPDCVSRPSDCSDIDVLNELDGFNLQPRLSIPFDGPIDVGSVTSQSVFLVSLGSTLPGEDPGGSVVGINQVVWDTFTNTLYVEPDDQLEQHTRYVLVVTSSLLDESGKHVKAAKVFLDLVNNEDGASTDDPVLDGYRTSLRDALTQLDEAAIVPLDQVVAASVFTTQSVTAVLEKIRDQIKASTPEPASFSLAPGGTRTVFSLSEVTAITFNAQRSTAPGAPLTPMSLNLSVLRLVPGAVGTVAFGKYTSPDYMVHAGDSIPSEGTEFIPAVGTMSGTPTVQGESEVFFNLFLPSGPKPDEGWPVAIFGPGDGQDKNTGPLPVAAKMAEKGIATIAINTPGSGRGPLSTLTVSQTVEGQVIKVTFPSGGRGIDQNGDGTIDQPEGSGAAPPRRILGRRDGNRQSVVDDMQLVRLIELGGVDVDDDGASDLDPSRMYYFGRSRGGIYGVPFLAIEPAVRVGVINAAGTDETFRLSPLNRPGFGGFLGSRTPSLINTPAISSLNGIPVDPPRFNENLPLRDGASITAGLTDGTTEIKSPMTNTVVGATEIQQLIDRNEWAAQSGDPAAYAPHLRLAPLDDVPAKSVILQVATGDRIVTNPTSTAVIRAGELADRTTFYRNDQAFIVNPSLPNQPHVWPHVFLIAPTFPQVAEVSLAAQDQIASFFASDGAIVIDPDPVTVDHDFDPATSPRKAFAFEVPIVGEPPEDLNFLP
jgi:Bacterial virulence factor lipase N-terminal